MYAEPAVINVLLVREHPQHVQPVQEEPHVPLLLLVHVQQSTTMTVSLLVVWLVTTHVQPVMTVILVRPAIVLNLGFTVLLLLCARVKMDTMILDYQLSSVVLVMQIVKLAQAPPVLTVSAAILQTIEHLTLAQANVTAAQDTTPAQQLHVQPVMLHVRHVQVR